MEYPEESEEVMMAFQWGYAPRLASVSCASFIQSTLAEFPGCTNAGLPELRRIHSLVEWLDVLVSTCDALPGAKGARTEEGETVYAKEDGAGWGGKTSELWARV